MPQAQKQSVKSNAFFFLRGTEMLVRIRRCDNRCLQLRYHIKAMHLSAAELSKQGNFSQHFTSALSRKSVSLIIRSFATRVIPGSQEMVHSFECSVYCCDRKTPVNKQNKKPKTSAEVQLKKSTIPQAQQGSDSLQYPVINTHYPQCHRIHCWDTEASQVAWHALIV